MSVLSDALSAVKEALLLSEKLERMGNAMNEMAGELREHERRLTRLEAQWETALRLTAATNRLKKPTRLK